MKTIGKKLSEVLDFSKATLRAEPVDFQVPVIASAKVVSGGPLPQVMGGTFVKWGSKVHESTFDQVSAAGGRSATVIERQTTAADGGSGRDRFFVQNSAGRVSDIFETVGEGDARTIVGHLQSDGTAEDP